MNELIRKRGFRISAVAQAIDIDPSTMTRWTDNAPIGKLVKVSTFTGIALDEIIHCLVPEYSIAVVTNDGGKDDK